MSVLQPHITVPHCSPTISKAAPPVPRLRWELPPCPRSTADPQCSRHHHHRMCRWVRPAGALPYLLLLLPLLLQGGRGPSVLMPPRPQLLVQLG